MSPHLALLVVLVGCTSFADENIVVDLRPLAITATLPEQVVDVNLEDPQQPVMLLSQLVETEVCALVADPELDRQLRYKFTLCVFGPGDRCDDDLPQVTIGSGLIPDPDTAMPVPRMCATVPADGNLLGILLETLEGDALYGLGGIDYLISLTVGGADDDPADDVHSAKALRVAARIPMTRTANANPSMDYWEITFPDEEPVRLGVGRCVDQLIPHIVRPGVRVRLTPFEAAGSREAYDSPTLDGTFQSFTESLTYQWVATAGSFSSGSTGGPRDQLTGNPAPLFTDWRAPSASDIDGPTDVELWMVQRDERYGSQWYQSCLRVVP